MRVKALSRGFYGRLLEQGDVFDIVDDAHLGSWMDPVDAADRARLAAKLDRFASDRRAEPPPGVPPTTGPGYHGGLAKAIMPSVVPPPAAAPKGREPKGEPPKA